MLDKLVPSTDYSVSFGSTALRSLQNKSLPTLDLLVREAIQNSSDAALSMSDDFFNVKLTTGTFKPEQFNVLLDDFTDILNERYPSGSAEFIEIRDSKTTGLTGKIRKSELSPEDHGNFFKLVFDMGKAQSQENAGGNWGYGKSAYYRAGIGFVIFYSQIKNGTGYEQRLIITYMEDEEKPDALLRRIKPNNIGKAWWGEVDNSSGQEELLPLIDASIIFDILNIFGIRSFAEDETGTSVIIPYIKSDTLLNEVISDFSDIDEDERRRYKWADGLDEYLRLSVQKWYAPTIFNKNLLKFGGGKRLNARVNGVPINKDKMRPFFHLVQELYTTALSFNHGSERYSSDKWADKITCHEVRVFKLLEKPRAGHVAVARLTQEELDGSASAMSPHEYLRHFNSAKDPIVMFARKLGMVIDYATADDWTKSIAPSENENEFIFAFFLPDSENTLSNMLPEHGGNTLEKYLRACEKSDHMSWYDDARIDLVKKIKLNTVKQVNHSATKEAKPTIEGSVSRLSVSLGKKLLPGLDYGKKTRGGGPSDGGGGPGSKTSDYDFDVTNIKILGDMLELEFALILKNSKKQLAIGLFIESESGLYDSATWKDEIGTPYPVSISEVTDIVVGSTSQEKYLKLDDIQWAAKPDSSNEFAVISIKRSSLGGPPDKVEVSSNIRNARFSGKFKLITSDKKYSCTLKVL